MLERNPQPPAIAQATHHAVVVGTPPLAPLRAVARDAAVAARAHAGVDVTGDVRASRDVILHAQHVDELVASPVSQGYIVSGVDYGYVTIAGQLNPSISAGNDKYTTFTYREGMGVVTIPLVYSSNPRPSIYIGINADNHGEGDGSLTSLIGTGSQSSPSLTSTKDNPYPQPQANQHKDSELAGGQGVVSTFVSHSRHYTPQVTPWQPY